MEGGGNFSRLIRELSKAQPTQLTSPVKTALVPTIKTSRTQTLLRTYKKNVSLYNGDQLLFFDLVEFFRFFPLRLGPTMFTSTNGRNIPENKTGTTFTSNFPFHLCDMVNVE